MTRTSKKFGPNSEQVEALIEELSHIQWLRPHFPVGQKRVERAVATYLERLKRFGGPASMPVRWTSNLASAKLAADKAMWAGADMLIGPAQILGESKKVSSRRSTYAAVWEACRDAGLAAYDAAEKAGRGHASSEAGEAAFKAAKEAVLNGYISVLRRMNLEDEERLPGGTPNPDTEAGQLAKEEAKHLVVADLLDFPSPWAPLLEVWRAGCWPICVPGKRDLLVYVPKR